MFLISLPLSSHSYIVIFFRYLSETEDGNFINVRRSSCINKWWGRCNKKDSITWLTFKLINMITLEKMLSLKLSTPKSTKGISERLILFCFNLSFRKASRALNKSIFQSVKLKKFIWINCFGYSIIFNKIYYHENNDWIRLGLLICVHRYLYLPQALFKRASNFKSWDYHLNSFIPRSSVSNHIRWVKVEVDCLLSTAKLSFVVKIERRREREGERERESLLSSSYAFDLSSTFWSFPMSYLTNVLWLLSSWSVLDLASNDF